MGLSSVFQTALSGISAGQVAVSVAANNLANLNTNGYKATRPNFAPQTPRTLSSGTAPSGTSGGTNPVQIGTGVQTVGTSGDFSQGTIAVSGDPLQIALEGEGFLVVQGPSGERSYTRNGGLRLNASKQLVTSSGERVLGYGVDDEFNVRSTEFVPLSVPLGVPAEAEDGSAATLDDYRIADDGRIIGRYSDGRSRTLGQLAVARFANPQGLRRHGGNQYSPGPNSGLAVVSAPGQGGLGVIRGGAVELSNADAGRSLIDMILAGHQIRSNVAVARTAGSLLDELTLLRR